MTCSLEAALTHVHLEYWSFAIEKLDFLLFECMHDGKLAAYCLICFMYSL